MGRPPVQCCLRRGPLSLSLNQAGGFFRSRAGLDHPNIQLYFQPLSYTTAPSRKRPLMSPDPFSGFLLSVQPCRPLSTGQIRIRSTDPFAPPLIQPNSLSHPLDLEVMLEGFAFLREIAKQPPLSEIIAEEIAPGPAVTNREEIIDFIRRDAATVFHPACTCRMGPDDGTNVVDAHLKVHGLDALRVVDASVFPNVTSGNINAPVIMVAERAADLILAA